MKNTNLVYGVNDKPGLWKTLVFAFQQLLAILAATIVVPVIINFDKDLNAAGIFPQMSQSAALFGAGVGTPFTFYSQSSKAPFSWDLLLLSSVQCARLSAVQARSLQQVTSV